VNGKGAVNARGASAAAGDRAIGANAAARSRWRREGMAGEEVISVKQHFHDVGR
jgi:hypothetical protein